VQSLHASGDGIASSFFLRKNGSEAAGAWPQAIPEFAGTPSFIAPALKVDSSRSALASPRRDV